MNLTSTELCVDIGSHSSCMGGEILLGAILLECTIYFILFVTGFKFIEWLKLRWKSYGKRKIR